MTYITKKEFAEKCGVTMPAISYAIKKKLVILARDGKRINISQNQNKEYLKNAEAKKADKEKTQKQKPTIKIPKKNVAQTKEKNNPPKKNAPNVQTSSNPKSGTKTKNQKNEIDDDGQLTMFALDRHRKQADLDLKEINIRMKQLELRRLSGELIPANLVQAVFETFSNCMMEAMKSSAESFRVNFISKAKLKPDIGAKMQGELIDMINEGHTDALIQAKAEMVKVFELAKQKNNA